MVSAYCEKCEKKVALKKSSICTLCGHKVSEKATGSNLKPSEIIFYLLIVFFVLYYFAVRPALNEVSSPPQEASSIQTQTKPKEKISKPGTPDRASKGMLQKLPAGELPASKLTKDWYSTYSERDYNSPFDGDIKHKAWVFRLYKENEENNAEDYEFAYPYWDKTLSSINQILDYLNLPRATMIAEHSKNTYTDPNYPIGEITFSHGRYCDCLGSVNLKIKQ